MMKYYYILLIILLFNFSISAQELVSPGLVKWYTLDQALKLSETQPRPIMIDVYTDWCSWCKFMMKTTFANPGIADYIQNNFYPVRFNAETFDTIDFKGKKYFNRKIGSRPSHDLASLLLDGQMSYPSLVFFDLSDNKAVIPGYKEPKDLEPILVYFAENVNRTASLNDFYINFMYSFPSAFAKDHSIFRVEDKLKPDTSASINWIRPEMISKLQKKNPRQILLYFYTDWSISSKVLDRTPFRDREIANKMNNTYYCIRINAASNDTINFLGKDYYGNGNGLPNQLSYAYLNNNFQMPAIVILDEKNTYKGMFNGFWAKGHLMQLLNYFYNDSFRKMSFEEYLKSNKLMN